MKISATLQRGGQAWYLKRANVRNTEKKNKKKNKKKGKETRTQSEAI